MTNRDGPSTRASRLSIKRHSAKECDGAFAVITSFNKPAPVQDDVDFVDQWVRKLLCPASHAVLDFRQDGIALFTDVNVCSEVDWTVAPLLNSGACGRQFVPPSDRPLAVLLSMSTTIAQNARCLDGRLESS